MDGVRQLQFEFEPLGRPPLTAAMLRQAVLGELARRHPTGLALRVPTRLKKFQVDVAAYWSNPIRRLNRVERTAVADIYLSRERCLPECANREGLLKEFRELKLRREALESVIRRTEPELRASDELFAEYQRFDYSRSGNVEYQKLLRRLEKVHRALFRGSRMEQIRQAEVADLLYMAVPEGLIAPDELIDGWGLWYVGADLRVREVRAAADQRCTDASRAHLAQNIGQAALGSVLFANGVKLLAHDELRLTRPPRTRRK